MPKSCCVSGCTVNTTNSPGSSFAIIPIKRPRRQLWLSAINRACINSKGSVNHGKLWSPKTNYTYVCSRHFITGKKVNDPLHPDYVPNRFLADSSAEDGSRGSLRRYNRREERAHTVRPVKTSQKKLAFPKQEAVAETGDTPGIKVMEEGGSDDATGMESGEVTMEMESSTDSPEHTTGTGSQHPELSAVNAAPTLPMDKPLQESERLMLHREINALRKERDDALCEVEKLRKLVDASNLSASSAENNNKVCKLMTGISWEAFLALFCFISNFLPSNGVNKASISLRDQLFLVLLKFRHNISFELLGQMRGISKTTVIDYFWKWTDLMHAKIGFMVKWPEPGVVNQNIPPVFKAKFPRLTAIVDCFEIFIDAPKNLLARAQCYSTYKKHCTVKVFISCTPLGSINFVSPSWGGRASDVKIVRESGFISPTFHMPGDQILADRGFTLKDEFACQCNAELLTPAFTKGKKQLSAREVETSRKISSVRIHIERVIGLIKNRYTILNGPLSIRCVQSLKDESLASTLSSCDKIITVCAALTNMGEGIVFK